MGPTGDRTDEFGIIAEPTEGYILSKSSIASSR
jgi:hypothetical protein